MTRRLVHGAGGGVGDDTSGELPVGDLHLGKELLLVGDEDGGV